MKTRFCVSLFCISLLLGCGKEATLVDPGFIGVWDGINGISTYHLSIDGHSESYWVKTSNRHTENAQGMARIRNGELHIGWKHFAVNQLPVLDTTTHNWTTILSGVTYTR